MDLTVTAAAILERLLHRSQVPNIRAESYWPPSLRRPRWEVHEPSALERYLSPKEIHRRANLADVKHG